MPGVYRLNMTKTVLERNLETSISLPQSEKLVNSQSGVSFINILLYQKWFLLKSIVQ
jgi:hypothetical protein